MGSRTPIVKFGIAGVIDLAENGTSMDIEDVASTLQATSTMTRVTWRGNGILAVTVQHCEDARSEPGSYQHQVPRCGPHQGVLYGHFFATSGPQTPPGQHAFEGIAQRMLCDYRDRGLTALNALNGAWVCAMLDDSAQRAIFARDAAGVETLYVAYRHPRVVYASDLRVLRAIGIAGLLDEQAIAEYMHYLYVPAPRTIYQDVHAVLPGHALIIDQVGMCQKRYAIPRFVQGIRFSDQHNVDSMIKEYLPQFENLLLSAVKDCIPKRGRVGLLLSGGKDSGSLAVALSQVAPERVIALTAGSQNSKLDESGDAARLCSVLGLEHQIYIPQPQDIVSGVWRLAACQDQPFGDPASLPLWLTLEHLPDDVSVVWDGNGNDYYFGHFEPVSGRAYQRRIELQRTLPRELWPILLILMRLGPRRCRSQAKKWREPIEESFTAWRGWTREELSRLWQHDISLSNTFLWKVMSANKSVCWNELQTEIIGSMWKPNAVFRKVVHLSHEVGRTARFPFVDNRLAQFVNGLPQELKFLEGTGKILLRAYLAKYLPKELVEKPKHGFDFDQNLVLQHDGRAWPSMLRKRELLQVLPAWSTKAIEDLLSQHEKRPGEYVDKMYTLCLIATWAAAANGHVLEGPSS